MGAGREGQPVEHAESQLVVQHYVFLQQRLKSVGAELDITDDVVGDQVPCRRGKWLGGYSQPPNAIRRTIALPRKASLGPWQKTRNGPNAEWLG